MFKKDKALNSVLFILQKEGGVCDMHKVCKVLYFADQKHLSDYGRMITGDNYIAMNYGPVPSRVYDMFKAVRGDSYFSGEELSDKLSFSNKKDVVGLACPDMDMLSESDVMCLEYAIGICKGKSFSEITDMSHGYAWSNTAKDRNISAKDMLREVGDSEEYVEYVSRNMELENASLL